MCWQLAVLVVAMVSVVLLVSGVIVGIPLPWASRCSTKPRARKPPGRWCHLGQVPLPAKASTQAPTRPMRAGKVTPVNGTAPHLAVSGLTLSRRSGEPAPVNRASPSVPPAEREPAASGGLKGLLPGGSAQLDVPVADVCSTAKAAIGPGRGCRPRPGALGVPGAVDLSGGRRSLSPRLPAGM